MKTMKSGALILKPIKSLGILFSKLATAVVSGLPREKIVVKPANKSIVEDRKENFSPDIEKHYHRPTAKPVVEKQTLHKEQKKPRVSH